MSLTKNQKLMFIASFMTWLQTYIVYKFFFRLSLVSLGEEILIVINSIGPILLIYGSIYFLKPAKRIFAVIGVSALFSVIMIANTLFYKFYDDIMTLPILLQMDNTGGLGSSVMNLIDFKVLFLVMNLPILMIANRRIKDSTKGTPHFYKKYFISMIGAYLLTFGLSYLSGLPMFNVPYNREVMIKTLGIYQYGLYDIYLSLTTPIDYALAENNEFIEVSNYVKSNQINPNSELFGVAKDQNIIVISLESLQEFAINLEVNGEEVTPFLNQFIQECYYFDNFYQQTSQGKTSDAEFITENSLYAADRGSAFYAKSQNQYESLASIFKGQGYYTAVFHANEKEFWNRETMYEALGFDHFFDESAFLVNEENSFGWGLTDEAFFEQTLDYLKGLPQPFYAKLLTLTNHYPFEIPEQYQYISPGETNNEIVNHYITTVRYLDEALKSFITNLKESGLYDNTIIVMYGDHYGLSESYYEDLAILLQEEEITLNRHLDLQRVPFIIHLPNQEEGEVVSTVSGQIDMKPTLLNLVGLPVNAYINFGQDLFAADRRELIVLRDGSFIGSEYRYADSTCLRSDSGELVDQSFCESLEKVAVQDLYYSDLILNKDLLRFQ
ncbi:LTA synthase family protein [Turicibacter bilis]|uniref:LTA synthase family protein n=1 Tax=Turicibacter bilis TaxID=2735723 RepID=UPI0006C1B47D|nr:LTA synthase family protein [Turicibacter bilis]MBS3203715.1 LTA synthase family protein [Turicibacter bilis]UUF10030.1 LTA synthase family protein [Turicibacter bilis]CUN98792.1 Lipoteichoic acid synthase 2 [Turicibacter sanguinis]